MAIREAGRTAIAVATMLAMGSATLFAAGGFDGISSASAASTAAAPTYATSTLVPRPSTTTTVRQAQDGVPRKPTGTALPEARIPAGAPSTTTTQPQDPYAWLENIPASGHTFLGVSTATGSLAETQAFAEAAGTRPDVVMITRSWADTATADIATIESLTAAGYLPMVAWEPWDHRVESSFDRRRGEQPDYGLGRIIDGDYDTLIKSWAQELAEWGRPVAIRFAHEMNGYWYPWSESSNGNFEGQYVAAWRHVHDIFTASGADNVIWVWSPNPTQPSLPPLAGLYPGDEYVDWLGLIGYLGNGIDPRTYVPTFDQLLGPTITEMREFSDLPLVITELGATDLGNRKADWITHVFDEIKARSDIVGVIWFEVNKETDWRIVSSPEANEAFAAAVADPRIGIPRG